MYTTTAPHAAGTLAATGLAAGAYQVVGAWTLLVAGLALVMLARVVARRARRAGSRA